MKEARFGILPVPTEFRKQPKIAKTQKLLYTETVFHFIQCEISFSVFVPFFVFGERTAADKCFKLLFGCICAIRRRRRRRLSVSAYNAHSVWQWCVCVCGRQRLWIGSNGKVNKKFGKRVDCTKLQTAPECMWHISKAETKCRGNQCFNRIGSDSVQAQNECNTRMPLAQN